MFIQMNKEKLNFSSSFVRTSSEVNENMINGVPFVSSFNNEDNLVDDIPLIKSVTGENNEEKSISMKNSIRESTASTMRENSQRRNFIEAIEEKKIEKLERKRTFSKLRKL